MKKEDLFSWGKRVVEQKGFFPFALRCFLKFVAFFWGGVSTIRNFAYDHRWLPIGKVSAFVVSIGNLVAGGTGKTPLTLMIAQKLLERGCKLAILSRGYGSSLEREKRSRRLSPKDHWVESGDEPLLFLERLKEKADVIVGKDRFFSARMAERSGSDTLLLDDGMQARFLHRDLEITLINGHDPFGQEAFLPFGLLREGPKGLQRSDYIIVNHVQSKEHFEKIKERLAPFVQKPMIGMRPSLSSIKDLEGKTVEEKTGAIALFCAIAQPHLFYGLVKKAGFSIVQTLFLPDHGFLAFEELLSFAILAKEKGAERILCTEKDRVKLNSKALLPLPVHYVEMELEILEGKEIFENLIQRIAASQRKKVSS